MININRISALWLLVIGWIYTTVFYATRLLTNASTPGGDAKRSLGYFETATHSSAYIPMWDPFAAMGKPAFADPEWLFYRLIAPLFNAISRDYYNLAYNLSILFLLLTLLTVLFFVARAVKTDLIFSAVFATLAVCSGLVWSSVESGRLNTLVIFVSALALIPLYKSWLLSKRAIFGIALVMLTSINLVFAGYYALVGYLFFAAFAYGIQLEYVRSHAKASLYWFLHLAAIGFLAILLSAAVLLPMMESQFENLISATGWGAGFKALSIESIIRLFVPFFAEQPRLAHLFPYLSFLFLPGLLSLILLRRLRKNEPLIYMSIIGLVYLFLAIGFALPEPHFDGLYGSVPIFNLIRWGHVYAQYSMLILMLLSMFGFSSMRERTEVVWIITAAMLFVVAAISLSYFQVSVDAELAQYRLHVIIISLVFILGVWFACSKLSAKASLYGVLLIGMCLHLVTPRATFFSHKSLVETPRTTNQVGFSGGREIDNDFHHGVRQYCSSMLACPLGGVSSVYGINGFSMYFPETTRNVFENVFDRNIDVQRPHWARRVKCPDLVSTGLAMANVKLIFCRKDNAPPAGQWSEIAQSNGMTLWHQKSDPSPHRLFYSAVREKTDQSDSFLSKMWDRKVLVIADSELDIENSQNTAGEGRIETLEWYDDATKIHVYSNKPAYLFSSILFSPGWQAEVNSNRVPIFQAFKSFQAIEIPAGESVIQLRYVPKTWGLGKWISSIALIVVLLLTLLIRSDKLKAIAPEFKYQY